MYRIIYRFGSFDLFRVLRSHFVKIPYVRSSFYDFINYSLMNAVLLTFESDHGVQFRESLKDEKGYYDPYLFRDWDLEWRLSLCSLDPVVTQMTIVRNPN